MQKKKEKYFEVMIAIADVAYFVQENSLIDQEARKRGNSFYFPEKVVPMLPEFLSNELCSLKPNSLKKCMVIKIFLDFNGNILSFEIFRAQIISIARYTYKAFDNDIKKRKLEKNNIINNLVSVFEILKIKSKERGKIDLELEEFQIVKRDNQFTIIKKENYISSKIVEEFMILANSVVASAFTNIKYKGIYRNHDKPNSEKLKNLSSFLRQKKISLKGKLKKQDLFNSMLKLKKHEDYFAIKEIVLRSQSKAYYHYQNIGHFGIALEEYSHFTSPIRRYSDLLAHRIVAKYILKDYKEEKIVISDNLCDHLLTQEKKSELIERDIMDLFCCLVVLKENKKRFSGYIDGITNYGMFIRANELPFSGLIRLRYLKDDFYVYNEKENNISGKKNGNFFEVGQKVIFKINKVNLIKGQISLMNLEKVKEFK